MSNASPVDFLRSHPSMIMPAGVEAYTVEEEDQGMLRNGSFAPLFELPSPSDELVSLHHFAGSPLVILFYRGRFCETTDRFLTAWQDMYSRIRDLGAELIGVSADTLEAIDVTKDALRLSFLLLSDPECQVGAAYGAYVDRRTSGRKFTYPALFVLDRNQAVAYWTVSSGPKGLPSP